MLDLLDTLISILDTAAAEDPPGAVAAVATIVSSSGSVPRPAGTSMVVTAAGAVHGSLSSGCVDGDIHQACMGVMSTGRADMRQIRSGSEDAFAAGLTCGGSLDVLIQPVYPHALRGLRRVGAQEPVALVRRIDLDEFSALILPDPAHFLPSMFTDDLQALLGSPPAARAAGEQLESVLPAGGTTVVRLSPDRETCADRPITLLVQSRLPARRFMIFGANDFSAALLPAARALGYRVSLCDARPAFLSQDRFAAADELVRSWPHEYLDRAVAAGELDRRSVLCVLSHDPKFDIPLLQRALRLDVAYLGALGSRRSNEQRVAALLAAGVEPARLARMHAPIGLDIGAVSPAEVAVAITAEIVASRRPCSTGRPLSVLTGPVHAPAGAALIRKETPSWT